MYYLGDEIGEASGMWDKGNTSSVLVRKHEGRRPSGKPKHGWEDNIKINLIIIAWEGTE
jgi:hypothetical protein